MDTQTQPIPSGIPIPAGIQGAVPPGIGTDPNQAPSAGDKPLDEKGIKAIQTGIQGAVNSVLSLLQPGTLTHQEVLGKVSDAILALEQSSPLGGLDTGQGLDVESLQEDTGEQGQEPKV